MIFTEYTRPDILRAVLDDNLEISLVSGEVYDSGRNLHSCEASFRWSDNGKTLHLLPSVGSGKVDLTHSFFMIKRDVFEVCRWSDQFKSVGHLPFFINLKNKAFNCYHTKAVSIDRWPETPSDLSGSTTPSRLKSKDLDERNRNRKSYTP